MRGEGQLGNPAGLARPLAGGPMRGRGLSGRKALTGSNPARKDVALGQDAGLATDAIELAAHE